MRITKRGLLAMKKMKYEIRAEKSYRKQYRLLEKRGYDMGRLPHKTRIFAKAKRAARVRLFRKGMLEYQPQRGQG